LKGLSPWEKTLLFFSVDALSDVNPLLQCTKVFSRHNFMQTSNTMNAIKNPEPSCCYAPGLQTLLLVELVHSFRNTLGNDDPDRFGCVHHGC
jgi:hypothetical protein